MHVYSNYHISIWTHLKTIDTQLSEINLYDLHKLLFLVSRLIRWLVLVWLTRSNSSMSLVRTPCNDWAALRLGSLILSLQRAGIAQSVQRITTGWTVRGSNPGGGRFSIPFHTGPGAHPTSHKMGTGSFPGVKRPGRGVNHPPPLAPRLKKE